MTDQEKISELQLQIDHLEWVLAIKNDDYEELRYKYDQLCMKISDLWVEL